MSSKLSRRNAIKALATAGAFLAAAPYIASASGALSSTPREQTAAGGAGGGGAAGKISDYVGKKEPLVIVIDGNQLLAFSGMQEIRVTDDALVLRIQSALRNGGMMH